MLDREKRKEGKEEKRKIGNVEVEIIVVVSLVIVFADSLTNRCLSRLLLKSVCRDVI